MKKLVIAVMFLLTCTLSAQNHARQVMNFSQLSTALDAGEKISVVFHYGKCKLMVDSVEEKSPEVSGGMAIDEYEHFPANTIRNPKGYIAFSKTVLIHHRKYGYVHNYVKCRVYEDNTVEINARYIEPAKFEAVMNETFYGAISDELTDRGVYFYRQ